MVHRVPQVLPRAGVDVPAAGSLRTRRVASKGLPLAGIVIENAEDGRPHVVVSQNGLVVASFKPLP